MSYAQSSARTLTLIKSKRKLAIVINLDHLHDLMTTYIDEEVQKRDQLAESMRFSAFLVWLRKRQQENTHAKKSD